MSETVCDACQKQVKLFSKTESADTILAIDTRAQDIPVQRYRSDPSKTVLFEDGDQPKDTRARIHEVNV